MFKFKILFFFAILIILLQQRVIASHIVSADIAYQHISGNKFKVNVTVIRDCGEHAEVKESYVISYYSKTLNQSSSFVAHKVLETDISPLCPTAKSKCQGGDAPGFSKLVYQGEVELPSKAIDWYFSWSEKYRSDKISTISSPGTQEIFIEALLNNVDAPSNNSPKFTNDPIAVYCVNTSNIILSGIEEKDNDRLEYALVTPKTEDTKNISYIAPFNAQNFLSSNQGISFDSKSGNITFYGNKVERSITALEIKEYNKSGKLIGSVKRDLQVEIVGCENRPPLLSGFENSKKYDTTIVAGTLYCFKIYGSELDKNQNIELQRIDTSSFGTFNVTGNKTSSPIGTFCWTPSDNDVGTKTFTFKVKDDACPFFAENIVSYTIKVNKSPCKLNAFFTRSDTLCKDAPVKFTDFSSGDGNILSWDWDFGNGNKFSGKTPPLQTYNETKSYTVTLVVKNDKCPTPSTSQRLINICEPPKADFSFVDSCQYKDVLFIDKSTSSSCKSYQSIWDFGDASRLNTSNPEIRHTYNRFGTFNVTLTSVNEGKCKSTVSKFIKINEAPNVQLVSSFFYKCNKLDTTIEAKIVNGPFSVTYDWKVSDPTYNWQILNNPGKISINIRQMREPVTFSVEVKDTKGCIDDASFTIRTPLIADFTHKPYCTSGQTIDFFNKTVAQWENEGPVKWKWTLGDGNASLLKNISHNYQKDTASQVTLVAQDPTGCIDSAKMIVKHVVPNKNFAVTPDTLCYNDFLLFNGPFFETVQSDITYKWNLKNDISSSTLVSTKVEDRHQMRIEGNNSLILTYDYNTVPNYQEERINYCSGTFTKDLVYVRKRVNAAIAIDGYCTNKITKIAATWTKGDTTVEKWKWNVYYTEKQNTLKTSKEDSTMSKFSSLEKNYLDHGSYNVNLSTIDYFGCSENFVKPFRVEETPQACFQIEGRCTNHIIKLARGCTDDTREVVEYYHWDFGKDNLEPKKTGSDAPYLFTKPDNYTIKMTVVNEVYMTENGVKTLKDSCGTFMIDTIRILPQPIAKFTHTSDCVGLPIFFNNEGTGPDEIDTIPIKKYRWNFTQTDSLVFFVGEEPIKNEAIYTYTTAGQYPASIIVENSAGCMDTASSIVNIYPKPHADFHVDVEDMNAYQNVEFHNKSSDDVKYWYFNFGDGNVSQDSLEASPFHIYKMLEKEAAKNFYDPRLIVKTEYGCVDTTYRRIDLNPYLTVPNTFSPNGDNLNDKFDIIQKGIANLKEFKIFNRWGELVFDGSGDLKSFWDGTFRGEEQPVGVYVFYISAQDVYGVEQVKNGSLTLLR